jgi:hypothetical protein
MSIHDFENIAAAQDAVHQTGLIGGILLSSRAVVFEAEVQGG